MNVWILINNLIVLLGLIPCIGLGIHCGAMLAQRLPVQQRLTLAQFARMAVRQVDAHPGTNSSKKALARASVTTLFKAFHLPMPAVEAIDIAIEAAMQEILQQ